MSQEIIPAHASSLQPAPLFTPTPQARHHFTQADQVNQLVGAREADSDLGFMARMMALPAGDLAADRSARHDRLRTALQGRHRLGGNFYFVVAAQPWIETQ